MKGNTVSYKDLWTANCALKTGRVFRAVFILGFAKHYNVKVVNKDFVLPKCWNRLEEMAP